jgi:hypothetical protein
VPQWKNGLNPSSPHGELVSRVNFLLSIHLNDVLLSVAVCAKWPWLVLLVGVAVAAALAVGVIYLEVTIDPVELWASPESRSRQEKDYFDKSFTPFYRTEQVILHAEGLTGVSSLSF